MFKITVLLLIVLIGHSYGRPVKSSPLSSANNRLGLNLLNYLTDNKSNVLISPISISTVFGMLYSGAKGQTAEEMRQVLGYQTDSVHMTDEEIKEQFSDVVQQIQTMNSEKYVLSIANEIAVQKDFNILDTFKQTLKTYYKSSLETLDFVNQPKETMDSINQWVSNQTHNKIEKLLEQPLSSSTRLVLLNAIYFKGLFQTKFLKNETEEEIFSRADGQQSNALMMKRKGKFNYTEMDEIDSKLLEIPYSGDDISLYLVLPNQRQGLKNVFNDFSAIERGISTLRELEVEVMVPKIKIESSFSLKNQFKELGMNSVFSLSADLSGIDGKQDLSVSDVLHKTYIEVTEEGTEAAAVSGIIVDEKSVQLPRLFRANHPFMFFIRNNKNGMVLFSGHINQA